MHPLLKTPKNLHQYKEGATFSKVMMLYRFDKKFRLLLFNEIEKIEIAVRPKLSLQEKVALFRSVFQGRDDVFAKRWYSSTTNKSGYLPVCEREWNREFCDKRKYKCADCPNRQFAPLSYGYILIILQKRMNMDVMSSGFILFAKTTHVTFFDCISLDRVQKHEQIDKETAARLRKLHLVEGRYPKLFLSEYVAKTTNNDELKTEYIKNRSFNDKHFRGMIISYLRSFGGATRSELNTLLQSKLSDVLTDEQKKRKIGNMLSSLKRKGMIELLDGKKWVLVKV